MEIEFEKYNPSHIVAELKKEEGNLRQLLDKVLSKRKPTELHITAVARRGGYDYYCYQKGNNRHIYLSLVRKRKQIENLCLQEYLENLVEIIEKRLMAVQKARTKLEGLSTNTVEEKMCAGKRCMFSPLFLDDTKVAEIWEKEIYSQKKSPDDGLNTEKGDIVRSKSEVMIANKLLANGLPYRYEAPLTLKGYSGAHPDFTIFNPHTRETIYWEHLGRMDDPEYAKDTIKRIKAYENTGYYVGDRLLLTFETKEKPLDIREIDSMIERIKRRN